MDSIKGEKHISSSVQLLLNKLYDFVNNFPSTKLDVSLLEEINTTLHTIQIQLVINDDDDDVKDMLGYAVFEVDNLFDKINTEALCREVQAQYQALTPTSQVLKNISYLFKRVNVLITKVQRLFPSRFKRYDSVITSKLQTLIERFESLLSSRNGQKGVRIGNPSPCCSAVVDKTSIYGRDNDINKLKHLLLYNDSDDSKTRTISIVGMAGIGKTALANFLYNDPDVKDKFGVRGWARVPANFVVIRVLETILESITSQTFSNLYLDSQLLKCNNTERDDTSDVYLNLLLATLQQILNTNIFLLVLDDVRDAKFVGWLYLMNILNVGETGSRIIITSQDERVAPPPSMQTFHSVHYLRPLESEDCWSLVARHAFRAWNNQQQSDLEEIGREIAKKCYGIPLAAISLGDFLHLDLSPSYWNYALESDIWELVDYDVHRALQLIYSYLSTPLKRCFAFCSIFPKKSILKKIVVVQLWIAEGLLESFADQEKVAEEYFDELVSRSLIHQQSIGDGEANFEMHDLVHDLATKVSSSYCIRLDEQNLLERIHNISYNRGPYDSFSKFDKLYGVKGIRTFLALPIQKQLPFCLLSNKVVHGLLPTMKQLRMLSLSNYKSITEVPKTIGNLLHLRYLNLSHTKIERLPSETCKLYNLQFLLLSGCKRFTELPQDIGKLVNLRHLDVSDTALSEMPVQIAKLENLHTLSDFVISKHNGGLKVAELGKFPHLHGKLYISQLQNVNDPSEAFQANLNTKERIHELALEWDCGSTFLDSQAHSAVLKHLQPSTNLKSLTIKGYGGTSFPNWLGDNVFGNMLYLRISNCVNCLWLPSLGQLGNLKELVIDSLLSIKSVGTEFYGNDGHPSFQPFPSLETLHFEDMPEWEEWSMVEGTTTQFPSLKSLLLSKCPKLRGNIPDKLPSCLTKLELIGCPLLVNSRYSDHNINCIIMFPLLDVFSQLMLPLNSLRQFTIDGFQSLMSFPTEGLPKTLKVLIISNCQNLEFHSHEYLHNYTSLEELKISYSCNSMISFTLGALPILKSLFMEGCKNLKSILAVEDASQKSLSFLRSIKIWDCNELESFPPGGLATPNLIYIALWKCQKLHSLPKPDTLTGLQVMEIDNLPNLQSFVINDLPTSLRELTIGSVGGFLWNTDPTWELLNCLVVLRIKGGDTVNTFMEPLLPASLMTLCISGLDDTRFDGKWLQHLPSLQNLEIVNAPKLKSLPKKELLSSLSVLNVTCCPLLEGSLRKKRGKEWHKISHIPFIIINDELIK
ncbi:putative P-loop containing nucleoside triphosphate hydrolase, leucine-rich repeat domain, L [Medicago truncatula]|uniref:NB-ARC domain disease resistance protein n=1 Tax=Medicago truncatula TaxID=3880 RepID=A0A072U0L3_MEDTR|nr:putative disease resistance protein At3g14460 [Medicago truncatula]KEH19320.1 NB-ARC domain disease resistance protein [Medicago truncatula]RHN40581.1 putative P-loop containing nucleoside triphosphate hydrolase, leucine-rich repeat domain, L [Medicago truncatula]